MSTLLQEALQPAICLHKYPKATIDVYVTVLESDGPGGCKRSKVNGMKSRLVNHCEAHFTFSNTSFILFLLDLTQLCR